MRAALVATALLFSGAAHAETIRPAPVPSAWSAWRTERIADGVHAFIAPEGVTPIVSGNTLVVIGDDGVLVVDTGQLPSIARQQIAAIRRLTDRPVRWIVTTHWHPDHWVGAGEYAAAWPGATLVATAATRAMILGKAMGFLTARAQRDTAAMVRGMLKDRLPALPRAYLGLAVPQFEDYAAQLETAALRPPTMTFDRAMTVRLGAREVQLHFLGRGATGGDAVVWIPDARVLAIGDLANRPYPYAIGSFLGEWPATLEALSTFDARVIVPGHGAPMRDRAYLEQVIALVRSVNDQVRAALQASPRPTVEQVRAAVDVTRFRDAMCGKDPWRRHGFDRVFLAPAVARAYREVVEGPLHDEN